MATTSTESAKHGYSYLALSQDCVRLVRVLGNHGGVLHLQLLENVPYVLGSIKFNALSYCWGDPGDTVAVLLNGLPFDITAGLHNALLTFLSHHSNLVSEYLWIDAICINQQDVAERSQQVAQMWRIYSGAEQVIAWLGPEDHSDNLAFDTLGAISEEVGRSFIQTAKGMWKPVGHADTGEDIETSDAALIKQLRSAYGDDAQQDGELSLPIQGLLAKRYFTRVWMIMELVQASKLVFICGQYSCSWDALHLYFHIFGNRVRSEYLLPPPLLARYSLYGRQFNGKPFESPNVLTTDILLVLAAFSSSECTDPRDTIFAVLGHPTMQRLDPRLLLRPDYTLTADELALVAIEWMDKIFVTPTLSHALLRATLNWLARGLKVKLDEKGIGQWIKAHKDWDCSNLPDEIMLPSGRVVSCRGNQLSYLVARTGLTI